MGEVWEADPLTKNWNAGIVGKFFSETLVLPIIPSFQYPIILAF